MVARISEDLVEILSMTDAPSAGLRKGIVIDIEECVSAISSGLEQAERASGSTIDKVIIGVGGNHIVTTLSKGIVAVSRPNGQIMPDDVERVVDAARAVALPPNQEIIHVIPKQFIVDGQEGVKDPLDMTGIRLETEALIIGGSTNALKNLERCVAQAGLKPDGLIFNGLASSKTLLNKKQKDAGVLLLDIGAATTTLSIWEEGDLIYANILAIGSIHVTNDIAIGLKISLEAAEQVKIKYAVCHGSEKSTGKIDLRRLDPLEKNKVDKELVAEIAEARMKEIFDKVRNELKAIGKDAMLPAGVILTGGGSRLDGCVELAKEELHLPVQKGIPVLEVSGATENLDNPLFSTAVGLTLEGLEESSYKTIRLPLAFSSKNLAGIFQKTKDFLRQLLP